MTPAWVTLLIPIVAISTIGTTGRAAQLQHCVLPHAAALAEGGFSGIANCDAGTFDAAEVGEITVSGKSYEIIDYRYRTPPGPGGSAHGGQRILVVEGGQRYLGQYVVGTPPFHSVWLRGNSVYIDAPDGQGNEIRFGDSGPPAQVYLTETPTRLFR